MKKYKEGFRRLSIAVGTLGAFAWIIFFLIASDFGSGFNEFNAWEWILLAVLTFASFLIPYFLVKGIFWILDGFSQKDE